MTWQFVKENWEELHKRYEGGFLLGRLIKVNALAQLNNCLMLLPASLIIILLLLLFSYYHNKI